MARKSEGNEEVWSWEDLVEFISADLVQDNIDDLLFLYEPRLTVAIESITNGEDLMEQLIDHKLIGREDLDSFKANLIEIGRADLVPKIEQKYEKAIKEPIPMSIQASSDDYYQGDCGKCIIINNIYMENRSQDIRERFASDMERLKTLFKWLCGDVESYDVDSVKDIVEHLKIAVSNSTSVDAFVVIILSQGDSEKGLCDKNGHKISYETIFQLCGFTNARHLKGIPKLFFILAFETHSFQNMNEVGSPPTNYKTGDEKADMYCVVVVAPDIIPDEEGTTLVQKFCSLMEEDAMEHSLSHIQKHLIRIPNNSGKETLMTDSVNQNLIIKNSIIVNANLETLKKMFRFQPKTKFQNFIFQD